MIIATNYIVVLLAMHLLQGAGQLLVVNGRGNANIANYIHRDMNFSLQEFGLSLKTLQLAEPFLRVARQKNGELRDLLYEERLDSVYNNRLTGLTSKYIDNYRYDLLTETIPYSKEANRLGLLINITDQICSLPKQEVDSYKYYRRDSINQLFSRPERTFQKNKSITDRTTEYIDLPFNVNRTLIFAKTIRPLSSRVNNSIIFSLDGLANDHQYHIYDCSNSFLQFNSHAKLPGCSGCYIVVYGDLDFVSNSPQTSIDIKNTFIICTGKITCKEKLSISGSMLISKEGIELNNAHIHGITTIIAPIVTIPKVIDSEKYVKIEKKENIKVINNFTLSDIGVKANLEQKTVVIEYIKIQSPWQLYGLRIGDKILTVDGVNIDSEHDLLRKVRKGYALGGSIITLQRGKDTLARVVYYP